MRALDNLDPQVHPAASGPTISTPASSCRSATSATTTPSAARSRASTPSCTSPRPSASASRCTRSSATRRSTRSAPPCVLEEARRARATAIRKLRRRLVDVDLRRRAVPLSRARASRGRARACGPRSSSPRREWEVLGRRRRRRSSPSRRPETKPLRPTSIYAIEQARPRGDVPRRSAPPTGSRPSRSASSTSTASVRRSRTRTPASPRSSPRACSTAARRWCSRTASQTRDFIDVRDIVRGCALALRATEADGRTRQPRHRPADLDRSRSRGRSRAGSARTSSPRSSSEYRAGDIRHCFADTRLAEELLGFRAEIAFEDGMRDLLAWLEGQEAVDARRRRARGARRARPRALSSCRTSASRSSTRTRRELLLACLESLRGDAMSRSSCSTTRRRTDPRRPCASAFPTCA